MAIKTAASNFDGQYKGYSIVTDDGVVEEHYPEDHAIEIADGDAYPAQVFLTQDSLMRAYGDTHALNIKESAYDAAWPANIRVQEHDVALVVLRMSCMDASRMMDAQRKKNDRTLQTEFIAAATKALNCRETELGLVSNIYAYNTNIIKSTSTDTDDLEIRGTTIEDAAARAMKAEDRLIVKSDTFANMPQFAHGYVIGNETLHPGFMARNAHIYLAALFSNETGRTVELPVAAGTTDPQLKIMAEVKKLGL